MTVEDKPIPRYQKIIALVLVVVAIAAVAIWYSRLSPDFYPLDSSRVGPNLLASILQWIILLVIGVLLWPPTRQRIHRFVDRKTATIHDHLEEAKADRQKLNAKLNHIIEHHPDIPPFRPPEVYPVDMTPVPPIPPVPPVEPPIAIAIPLPTWTDGASVATYVTFVLGAALTIIAVIKPGWHPSFNVQAVAIAMGTLVSSAAMIVNVIRHLIVTKALVATASSLATAGSRVTMARGKRQVIDIPARPLGM